MKRKSLLFLTLSLLLVLSLGVGTEGLWEEARAEEPQAPVETPLFADPVGTGFTYQGRLMDGGSPVTDTCDFMFTLLDSDSNKVGTTQDLFSVAVSDGLFTVQLNGGGEFSADAFTGEARWLEIKVRCPAGSGSYITLTPTQELTATPYALSLRPEAKVAGVTAAVDQAILTVENTGMGIGVKVDGASYGVRSSGYFGVHGEGSVGVQGIGSYGVAGYSDASPGYGIYGNNTNINPDAYGVYGESAASYGGAALYGLATGEGGTTGVQGEATSGLGTGVYGEAPFFGVKGFASATSGTNYGVYGESGSPDGYGVYAQNTGGGVAIYAGGSGIIKSAAESRLAINPFEIEPTSIAAVNLYLEFTNHWEGYAIVENTSGTGARDIYVPVHNLIQLFGSPLKLKSLDVCYDLASSSSYIDETKVYYANDAGGRTELLASTTNRTSTAWDCYTVSTGSPAVIDGPMFVYLKFSFAGTGSSHTINIGRMVATLVE